MHRRAPQAQAEACGRAPGNGREAAKAQSQASQGQRRPKQGEVAPSARRPNSRTAESRRARNKARLAGDDGSAPPPFLTIAEAGRLIAAKKLSPVELVTALLARIAAIDPQLNAFLLVTERQALAAARAAERAVIAGRKGAAAGHSGGLQGHLRDRRGAHHGAFPHPGRQRARPQDAETVRRLHAAGAVMLGKLATHEFAIGGPAFDLPWPPARNPWDTRRFTGGSSVRLGRGGGGGAGAGGAGVGYRRLDPAAGGLLRDRRA